MQNFEFYRKKPKLIMKIFWRDIQQMLFLSVHNMKQKRHNFYHLPIIISKSKYLIDKSLTIRIIMLYLKIRNYPRFLDDKDSNKFV